MTINIASVKRSASIAKTGFALLVIFGFVLMFNGFASADTPPDGARVTQSSSCKSYSGQAKKACGEGFGATLGDKGAARALKNEVPTKDYNSEETTDAAQACDRYKNNTNKKACIKGYKDGHYAFYHKTDHSPLVETPTKVHKESCPSSGCSDPAADPDAKCDGENCDFIKKFVNPAINMLSISFGVIAVISIIIGGINYSTSEGDPQKTSRAKNRIFNTVIAIVAYMFLWAFLQFLVPGGAFK